MYNTRVDDPLAALLDQPGPPGTSEPPTSAAVALPPSLPANVAYPAFPKPAIAKLSYTHDAMINLILSNPGISQNEIALQFGYSASWISQVMTSDAFQARLMERSAELIDPTIRASIEEQFRGLVNRSMDIVRQKLAKAEVTDQFALRALEVASRAAGYGARDPLVAVQVNVDNHLDDLGSRLIKLLDRKKAEVHSEPIDVITQEP